MDPKLTKAALFAAGVVVALGLVASMRRPAAPPKTHIETAALLAALKAAKQPISAAMSVQKAGDQGEPCNFAEVASRAALDANRADLVQAALDAAPKGCPRAAILQGERAEALARAGSVTAEQTAQEAIKAEPANPYALLALARLSYDKNQMTLCSDYAEKALQRGRGAEASRLIGRSDLARGRFKEAQEQYQNVLHTNDQDAEAAFSTAICADKLGNYLQAREGFLQTLRIDPKHVEARRYLVVLTFKAGAKDEARHHFQKLAELLPKDSPVLLELEQALSSSDSGADSGSKAK